MAFAVLRLAGPGADISLAPLRSAMVSALKPLRTTNCSIFQTLVWLLTAIYIATPGFLTLAFNPSSVTSTTETSIWLVIMAATFGGPPISLVISGSMFCSLKNPFSSATKYGSEELTGKTPTETLSCASTWPEAATPSTAIAQTIRRFSVFMKRSCHTRLTFGSGEPGTLPNLQARNVPVSGDPSDNFDREHLRPQASSGRFAIARRSCSSASLRSLPADFRAARRSRPGGIFRASPSALSAASAHSDIPVKLRELFTTHSFTDRKY